MTRRGVMAALTVMVGALTDRFEAQGGTASQLTMLEISQPTPVRFDLRGFKSYTFTLDGDTVTFTPEQMMAALRREP